MTTSLFVTLLTVFSAVTSVCTEAGKKILDDMDIHYSANLLAFIIACVVGIFGTAAAYVLCSIDFNAINVVCMLLMGVATSVGATVGYDKVMQTISQIKIKA